MSLFSGFFFLSTQFLIVTKKVADNIPEISGDMTHDMIILRTPNHEIALVPFAANPKPRIAPIVV
jgi:hypothetical protein